MGNKEKAVAQGGLKEGSLTPQAPGFLSLNLTVPCATYKGIETEQEKYSKL